MPRWRHVLPGVAAALLVVTAPTAAQGFRESLLYLDLRAGLELSNAPGRSSGLYNYASRAGWRGAFEILDVPTLRSAVFHAELGAQEDRLRLDGTRLLYAGLRADWGNLSYGRQWGAYYNAIGQYLDRSATGLRRADPTSQRVDDSLQYSHTLAGVYVQVDWLRSPGSSSRDRLQVGLDTALGADWQMGLALDLGKGRGPSLGAANRSRGGAVSAIVDESRIYCELEGVDCIGGRLGWSRDDLSVQAGVNRVFATDVAHSLNLSVRFAPANYELFLQIGSLSAPGNRVGHATIGLHRRMSPYLHLFGEASLMRTSRLASNVIATAIVGARIQFERRLH